MKDWFTFMYTQKGWIDFTIDRRLQNYRGLYKRIPTFIEAQLLSNKIGFFSPKNVYMQLRALYTFAFQNPKLNHISTWCSYKLLYILIFSEFTITEIQTCKLHCPCKSICHLFTVYFDTLIENTQNAKFPMDNAILLLRKHPFL